jgi:hypothetical protein
MEDWIDQLADALGVPRMTPKEMGTLLKLSREVAHRVERKYAPLSTYLAGLSVGRRTAAGEPSDQALRGIVEDAMRLVPEEPA